MSTGPSRAKEILQWRNPVLDLNSVADAEHRKLLSASTVIAEGLEVFKQRVKQRVFAPPPRVRPFTQRHAQKFIFINTESGDRKIAERIAECITRKGFGFVLSRETRVRKADDCLARGAHIVFPICAKSLRAL